MVLAEHRALVERATTEHGGVVVEHEGDSMLTVFGSADHAFRAADAIHTHLAGRWPGATGPSVRIGIHTDHAAPVGDRYVTLAVHQVARIATCGHGGQTLVSDATRRELSGSLPTADLGLFWLRDFDEPARLHQACTMNETADSFPDLRAAPFLEPGFETEVTSFIGRAEQVELLVELLGQHRLVSVVGLGGAGKSRLAREVARHLSRPDGVRLVELASVRSLASLPAVVASAVGLRLDDDRPHRDLLIQHLRATSMVLVLDNCEHLERAVGALAQAIVGACPAVGLLCTSRTAIGVAGERVWRIPPLARDEGVDLFCDRADALSGLGSSLHEPEQRSAIGRLCDDLDGLPLAIELAAGCTETMTVAEIASRLNDRFRLLVSSSDSSP